MLRRDLPGGRALRLFEESDADELHALVEANRTYLEPWLPWVEASDRDSILDFIRRSRRQLADNDGFQLAVLDGEAIAGAIGLHRVDWQHRATSIGYWLAADRQGRGMITGAARAILDHVLGTWELHRVDIRAAVENVRSRAIAERLGFREEGTLREVERVGGRYLDHVVYGLLAQEWR